MIVYVVWIVICFKLSICVALYSYLTFCLTIHKLKKKNRKKRHLCFSSPFSWAVQFFKISIHLLQFYDKYIAFWKLSSFVFFHHCLLCFLLVSSSYIYIYIYIKPQFWFCFERERERVLFAIKGRVFLYKFYILYIFHYYLYIFVLHICGFVETLDWPFHFSLS